MNVPLLPAHIAQVVDAILAPYGLAAADLRRPETDEVNPKKYLSVAEAEEYSSLGRWTLHRLAKSGTLPIIKLSPAKSGKVLIDRQDLDRVLKKLKKRG